MKTVKIWFKIQDLTGFIVMETKQDTPMDEVLQTAQTQLNKAYGCSVTILTTNLN